MVRTRPLPRKKVVRLRAKTKAPRKTSSVDESTSNYELKIGDLIPGMEFERAAARVTTDAGKAFIAGLRRTFGAWTSTFSVCLVMKAASSLVRNDRAPTRSSGISTRRAIRTPPRSREKIRTAWKALIDRHNFAFANL